MSKEIKKRIDELHEELKQVYTPGIFTLNKEITRIQEEINTLQMQCEHNFIEGQCEYCHIAEVLCK